jgi:hypothetical protein
MRHTTTMKMMTIPLTALLVLLTGCSSGGGERSKESAKTIEGFSAVKKDLGTAQAQVDQALAAMNKLNAGGDLAKSYSAYSKEVDDVEKAGAAARKRGDSMRKNTNAYITKWQKDVESIQDPTIKASLAERREVVRTNFNEVKSAAGEVRAAYGPFLSSLQQIQKALAVDLSPAALPGLKPAMNKAQADGTTLKQKIAAVQKELDEMQAGMSSTGAVPKKT